jgi:hypothetical protein
MSAPPTSPVHAHDEKTLRAFEVSVISRSTSTASDTSKKGGFMAEQSREDLVEMPRRSNLRLV